MLNKIISHLPYLTAVAKHNSFSKAADEIALTQSALSYQIQKLEEKLGFKVFVRGKGSKIELTRKGELLVDEFNRLEKGFNHLLGDIQIHQKKTNVKISLPVDFGVKVITPLLPIFENENIPLELDLSDDVISLKKSEFDFAIRNTRNEKGVAYLELLKIENVVFCSKEYADKYNLKTTSDIKQCHRLIVRNKFRSQSWEFVFQKIGGSFQTHQNKQLISNSFGMLESALASFGICILPKYFLSDLEKNKRIVVLEDAVKPTTYFIAYQESSVAEKWTRLIKKIILSNSVTVE